MPWDHRTKRRLKLRDLDILLAVVETGSMGKAAKRLNTSQPAVSKAVVELESAFDSWTAAGAASCRHHTVLRSRSAASRSSTTCDKECKTSIFFPIRPRAKFASERPNRSRRQLSCLRLTDYRANTRRCSFTSSPAIRRRCTEMSVNEILSLRFVG